MVTIFHPNQAASSCLIPAEVQRPLTSSKDYAADHAITICHYGKPTQGYRLSHHKIRLIKKVNFSYTCFCTVT